MSIAFVCIMGIATVFIGLIALIIITTAMSAVCRTLVPAKESAASAPSGQSAPNANRDEIIAATCAVIAEELGEDVSNIRVTSFKKL